MINNTKLWFAFLGLLLILHIPCGLKAQKSNLCKVSGNVVTTDGEPAEFISVSLKNTTIGAMTDSQGKFEFHAPAGEYTLVIFSILAHKKEQQVAVKANAVNHFENLEIIENINQLGDVVVTGQFTPQSLRNSLYKIRVVNHRL